MLTKKQSTIKKDSNGYMFAMGCMPILCADYIAYRLIYNLEPLTLALPTLCKSVEIAEKSLKVFISLHEQKEETLAWLKSDFGHNIEALRKHAATINPLFNDTDIKKYTYSLNDKSGQLYQAIRYGSHTSIDGISAKLKEILPVIDKIFFKSLLLLPKNFQVLIISAPPLKHLLMNSRFDQTRNRDLLLKCLKEDNDFIQEYLDYCEKIDKEYFQKK